MSERTGGRRGPLLGLGQDPRLFLTTSVPWPSDWSAMASRAALTIVSARSIELASSGGCPEASARVTTRVRAINHGVQGFVVALCHDDLEAGTGSETSNRGS
jgi:hypothetical protein